MNDRPNMIGDETAGAFELLAALAENKRFYEDAASNLRREDLRDLFARRAVQRARFVADLQAKTATDLVADFRSLFSFLERGLLTVRAAMAIEPELTDRVVLADAQEEDTKLLEAYQRALAGETLSPGLRETIAGQAAAVRAAASYVAAAGAPVDEATVVALFADPAAARKAAAALLARGVDEERVMLVAEEEAARAALGDNQAQMTGAGAGAGALGGGAFGGIFGLLSGLGMAVVMGPVAVVTLPVAAGATAVGATIGAAYGGMFGGLLGYGIADEDVQVYMNGLRHGQVLLVARVPEMAQEDVAETLAAQGGENVATRYRAA